MLEESIKFNIYFFLGGGGWEQIMAVFIQTSSG